MTKFIVAFSSFFEFQEGEEELEEDELPEWKRPQEPIDLSRIDPNDPESVIQMSKKGRTLMMFATVSGWFLGVLLHKILNSPFRC